MTSLFISYSRKDIEAARKLAEAFKGQGLDLWIDWEGIPPTVDWWKEIEKGIEEADIFLFLISPDSAKSKICRQEIDCAVRNGKRLIPLVVRDVKDDEIPEGLGHLNWMFFRETDEFDSAFNKLQEALKTDYAWAQTHRQLQVKALEWGRGNKDESFLLHGIELRDAEFQLATNTSKEPHPTDLQREYVFKSRQASDVRRRRTRSIGIGVIIALIVLSVFAWIQAGRATISSQEAQAASVLAISNAETAQANEQEAKKQEAIALARQLAAQAVVQADSRPDRALLLAQESINLQSRLGLPETQESLNSLLTTMLSGPRPLLYLRGHTQSVMQVAISPDSRWIASASADETIRIWDILRGQSIFTLTGHTGPVNSIAFSSTGEKYVLASGGSDGTVRLWEWEDAEHPPQSMVLAKLNEGVHAVAFSPSEEILAAGGADKFVRIYEWDTKRVRYTLGKHTGAVTDLAFSTTGTMLVSSDDKLELRLWDPGSGELINEPYTSLSATDQGYEYHVTFSPSYDYLAAGYGFNAVLAYYGDPTDSSASENLVQHTSTLRDLTYNHDGTRFASASEDWRIGYCYTSGFRCDSVIYLKAHDGPVNSVAFSMDDKWLVSGGEDGNVLVWNALFPYLARSLPAPLTYGQRWNVEGLAFSADGRTLASSNWDLKVRLWNVDTGSIIREIDPGQGTLGIIALSPDGTKLTFSADNGPYRIWNTDGSVERTLPVDGYISAVAFSPDGRWLATDDGGKTICLWSMVNEESSCHALPENEIVSRLAFSPDSRFLASNAGAKVLLWDLATEPITARTLGSHSPGSGIFGVAFSPDGKRLASGGSDYTINVWDVEKEPASSVVIRTSGRFARSVAFSPDGVMLVSANEDWTVRWWHADTGQPLVAPVQVRSLWRIDSVAFSPDGKWLATGSFDGIIDIWPGNVEEWKTLACKVANRNLTRLEYAQFIDPDPESYDTEYAKNPTCLEMPLETETVATP